MPTGKELRKRLRIDTAEAARELGEVAEGAKTADDALDDLGDTAKKTSGELGDFVETTRQTNDSTVVASKSTAGFRVDLVALAGAAVTVITTLAALAKQVVDLANEITDMSLRTGQSAETILGLKLAAEGAGLGLSDLDSILNPLSAKMGQVAAGSAGAEQSFNDWDISVRDLNGNLVDNDEALRRVVARIQAMEDPAQRSQAAMTLLGESGGKLIQALGGNELDDFVRQAKSLNGALLEVNDTAGDAQRNMSILKAAVEGIGAEILKGVGYFNLFGRAMAGMVFIAEVVTGVLDILLARIIGLGEGVQALVKGDLEALNASVARDNQVAGEALERIVNARKTAFEFLEQTAKPGGLTGTGAAPTPRGTGDGSFLRDPDAPTGAPVNGSALLAESEVPTATKNYADALKRSADQAKKSAAAADKATKEQKKEEEARRKLNLKLEAEAAKTVAGSTDSTGGVGFTFDSDFGADTSPAKRAPDGSRTAAFNTATAAASGNALGLVAAAGPIGETIAGAIQAVLNVDALLEGIVDIPVQLAERLPVTLVESIPNFISALITDVIPAIGKLILQLPGLLIKGLLNALVAAVEAILPGKQKGERKRERQASATARAARDDLLEERGLSQSDLRGLNLQERLDLLHGSAGGDPFVRETGKRLVHQGEKIIPANGVGNPARHGGGVRGGRAFSSGGDVNIVINNPQGTVDAKSLDRWLRGFRSRRGTGGLNFKTAAFT